MNDTTYCEKCGLLHDHLDGECLGCAQALTIKKLKYAFCQLAYATEIAPKGRNANEYYLPGVVSHLKRLVGIEDHIAEKGKYTLRCAEFVMVFEEVRDVSKN